MLYEGAHLHGLAQHALEELSGVAVGLSGSSSCFCCINHSGHIPRQVYTDGNVCQTKSLKLGYTFRILGSNFRQAVRR